jgi:hypothetical protein
MAAFALQRDPAIAVREQAGNAQPGARSDDGDGCCGDRVPASDFLQFIRAQSRYREGKRSEIVDDVQTIECEGAAGLLD